MTGRIRKSVRRAIPGAVAALLAAAATACTSSSTGTTTVVASAPEAVVLGDGVVGALYSPAVRTDKAAIAVFVMHAEQDYFQFSACTELSKRVYTVLCADGSAGKNGASNDLDTETWMTGAAEGVGYLRGLPTVKKVVLFGHSGGGAMMASYQNIAENGVQACNGPEKIAPCSEAVAHLPKADGILLADANYGISTMTLLSLDPAITDENDPATRDPALDLYDPANGFTPTGSHYTPSFTAAFQRGVAARMNRLIADAQTRKAEIAAGTARFPDDDSMTVPGANYLVPDNRFFPQDPSYLAHTTDAWPLLHADGTETTEVVHTVRPPSNLQPTSGTYATDALKTSVKRFLSTFAIRVGPDFAYHADGLTGVDWASSNTTPIGAAPGITVPLLTMGMTGHWEFLAAEKIYQVAGSKDKSIAFVDGASHIITPCQECAQKPGQYGDTLRTTYDHMDRWLAKPGRFLN
ncbi:hypothetical protein K7711_16120 [Nocardia sp. CA2R105]|uniref:hypothetical protein n=1 Tax=Nocardia coffeae TaxID=2873381 RepID=UPI001CA62FEA|nr:hypothetical protein [Nocardia coffeae]MBY8858013.1 hypothetical protein [Nocardia coffeae]